MTPVTLTTPSSSSMDINTAFYQLISYETRDYYEKVSKGLIKERPYDYWGPDTAEEKAHWDQWWLPIQKSFYPINWESGFTGRGSKSFLSFVTDGIVESTTVHLLKVE